MRIVSAATTRSVHGGASGAAAAGDAGSAGPIQSYKLTSADGHLWRELEA